MQASRHHNTPGIRKPRSIAQGFRIFCNALSVLIAGRADCYIKKTRGWFVIVEYRDHDVDDNRARERAEINMIIHNYRSLISFWLFLGSFLWFVCWFLTSQQRCKLQNNISSQKITKWPKDYQYISVTLRIYNISNQADTNDWRAAYKQ